VIKITPYTFHFKASDRGVMAHRLLNFNRYITVQSIHHVKQGRAVEHKKNESAVEILHDNTLTDYLNDKAVIIAYDEVSFYRDGELHHAALLSLSEHGARFISPMVIAEKIVVGRTGEYYFRTSHGTSKCRGITRKIFHFAPAVVWEIEFIELSENEDDPLRKILDDTVKGSTGLAY
jgi:hypothetical protein